MKNSMGQSNNLGDKLPELGKEGEKAIIIGETKQGLRGLKMAVLAGGVATILGTANPAMSQKMDEYEPLADASGTMLVKKGGETSDTQQIQEIIRKSGASKNFEKTVISMSEQDRQLKQQTGKSILRVQAISKPSQLVNDGSRLKENKIFKMLTEANYRQVVSELFDISDINDWLRNADGSELSQSQIANYKEQMGIDTRRYGKKLDDFKTKFGEKSIKQFFDLYNLGATKMSHQSREELRRLFVAASSIVFFVNSDDNTRTKYAGLTATQLGEYTTLTGMNKDMIIAKIMVGESSQDALKYLFPGEITVNNFNQSTGLNVPTNLSEIALRIMTESFDTKVNIIKNNLKVQDLKAQQELIHKDTEETKKRIQVLREENERIEKEREQTKKSIQLNKQFGEIADKIELGIKGFVNNPGNKNLETEINGLIAELRRIKKQSEQELTKENQKGIIALSGIMESTWIPKFLGLTKTKS